MADEPLAEQGKGGLDPLALCSHETADEPLAGKVRSSRAYRPLLFERVNPPLAKVLSPWTSSLGPPPMDFLYLGNSLLPSGILSGPVEQTSCWAKAIPALSLLGPCKSPRLGKAVLRAGPRRRRLILESALRVVAPCCGSMWWSHLVIPCCGFALWFQEHAEFYAQCMAMQGLRSTIQPDGALL